MDEKEIEPQEAVTGNELSSAAKGAGDDNVVRAFFPSSKKQSHTDHDSSRSPREESNMVYQLDKKTPSIKALASKIDWYGNTTLHHAFATNDVDLDIIKEVLARCPEYASARNQFNRIPLHYALDRIKTNLDAVKILLKYYAAGVSVKDVDSKTPYDLAVKWKHPLKIRKMLLEIEPDLDRASYLRMRYGPLATIYGCFDDAIHPAAHNKVYTEEMTGVGVDEQRDGREELSGRPRSFNRLTKSASFSGGDTAGYTNIRGNGGNNADDDDGDAAAAAAEDDASGAVMAFGAMRDSSNSSSNNMNNNRKDNQDDDFDRSCMSNED